MSGLADIDDRQLAWGHVALRRRATAATYRRTRRAPARNARRRKREGIGTCAAHRGQPHSSPATSTQAVSSGDGYANTAHAGVTPYLYPAPGRSPLTASMPSRHHACHRGARRW